MCVQRLRLPADYKLRRRQTSKTTESRSTAALRAELWIQVVRSTVSFCCCEGLPGVPRSIDRSPKSPGCKRFRLNSHVSCESPNQPLRLLLFDAILVPKITVRAGSEDWNDTTAAPESEKRSLAIQKQPPQGNAAAGKLAKAARLGARTTLTDRQKLHCYESY